MPHIASHARFWKSVPLGASGTSNTERLPERYSTSWLAHRLVSASGEKSPSSWTRPSATFVTDLPSDATVTFPNGML